MTVTSQYPAEDQLTSVQVQVSDCPLLFEPAGQLSQRYFCCEDFHLGYWFWMVVMMAGTAEGGTRRGKEDKLQSVPR